MELEKIIGKKVKTIRGFSSDKRRKRIDPCYVLFDDGETFIELIEQDYYSYHDCSYAARIIRVIIDKKGWLNIFNNLIYYPEANRDY